MSSIRAKGGPLLSSVTGSLVVQALGVITGILLARGLGPSDRGAFAAMVLWPTVAVTLGDLGLANSFSYYTARGRAPAARMLRTAVAAAAVQSVYLVPIALILTWVGLLATEIKPVSASLTLTAAFVPAALVSRYVAAVFQGQLRMRAFYAIRLAMSVTIALALLFLLVIRSVDIWTAVVAYIVGLAIMTVVTALLVLAEYRHSDGAVDGDPPGPREFVDYGLRSLPGSLYPVESLFVDQMIVALFLGPYALGLYVTAIAFTSLPRLVAYGIGVISMPTVARAEGWKQREATTRYLVLTAIALVPMAIVLSTLMSVLVPLLFGSDFSGAVTPAILLLGGSVAYGIRRVLGDCLRGARRPGVVSLVEVLSWPLVVVCIAATATQGLVAVCAGVLGVQVVSLFVLLVYALPRRRWPNAPPAEARMASSA